jgi:nitroreductase
MPYRPIPLDHVRLPSDEQIRRAEAFASTMARRRTVRDFSADPVPGELIDAAIRTAASAPSGANLQPWKFVVIREAALRRQIRLAAEHQERDSYERRMPAEWREALEPLGTDWHKPFLEVAPLLIVVFKQDYGIAADGRRIKHYYVNESVGIACGFLLAALHQAGLATLTHTPSPMGFLSTLLDRPPTEKPYLLIPVGYPAPDAQVPDITRKALSEVRVDV